ncbi:Ger(x)C family spore germination protein [Paenibacillus andongensis]|uniref:Ger(x)C family spore germination protein n=1 Tax=Paenibacillus andongensis TaxID=2975482 RepID=UPI0021BAF323|nr:Ger(x)C family spore germination protein [Paenibacillus andongensis]
MLLKKSICWPSLLCIIFFLTGCWDRIEIDQRGFVVGVAIDYTNNSKHKFKGTYQIVVPSGLKQSSQGQSGSGSSGKAYFNLSSTENSMPALSARLAARTSRSPYFEHLKIIIVSSEVAKDDKVFADVLDYFLRNSEMRRGVQILIADGKASDILDIPTFNEPTPIDYITSIARNDRKSNFMLPESRIGDVHEYLVKHESFPIQNVKLEEKGVSMTGSAIFDGQTKEMVGFLTGAETQGLNFVTDHIKGGIIEATFKDHTFDFRVERTKSKITMQQLSPTKFKFNIKLAAEGVLEKSIAGYDPSDSEAIKYLEKSLEDVVQGNTLKVIKKLQQTYKKDALGLGAYLYENHYKVWKPIAADWEQGLSIFTQSEINVQAEVIIRRIGNIYKTTKE